MRKAAFVCVTGTLLLWAGGEFAVPARAQYVNPYTGNNWNNPNSSLLDTAIMNARNRMMLDSALSSSASAAAIQAAYVRQLRSGESRIKSGNATTRFTGGPFPTDYWVTRSGGDTPAKRKQYASEFAVQREIWTDEVRSRSADSGDMAQALGLAFVLAWEAQSGEKATMAQYKGITQDFRAMLLKDPLYQGMDETNRQRYFEGHMINATDAVRLLRASHRTNDAATRQKAAEEGREYIKMWVPKGFTHFVTTPTGFHEVK